MNTTTPKLSKRAQKRLLSLKGKLLLKSGSIVKGHYGKRYQTLRTGAVVRLTERPWRGKSERRQVIKMRRAFKA